MRVELKDLQRRTGITFVYVTHDQAEALALSDQVAVMQRRPAAAVRHAVRGLCASGQPHGRRLHGAGEPGAGTPARGQNGGGTVDIGGELTLDVARLDGLAPGDSVDVAIRPENIRLAAPTGDAARRGRPSPTTSSSATSANTMRSLPSGQTLRVQTHPLQQFAVGDRVAVEIDATQCSVFRRDAVDTPDNSTCRMRCSARDMNKLGVEHEQAPFARRRPEGRGALDQQGQRCPPVPVEEIRRSGGTGAARILFVHGSSMASTADVRPAGAGPAVADGLFRGARLRHLVRRHGGLRPLHQGSRPQLADLLRRRRLPGGRAIHREAARQEARCWSTASRRARCAPRCSRSAIPNWSQRLACDAMVWTGEGSPTLAERREEAARVPRQEPPADRPQVRALDLRARSSGHRRRQRDRGVRRRHPRARRFDPERHLCRHVLQPAGVRSRRRSRCRP